MDDYKPEEELKTDLSDRPSPARRRPGQLERPPVSRQNLVIGIAVLALLVLIISLSASLKTSVPSGQSTGSGAASAPNRTAASPAPAGNPPGSAPQTIQVPPVAAEPAQPATTAPAASSQHRLEVPGDRLNDALLREQRLREQANNSAAGLPVAPAEVSPAQPAHEAPKNTVPVIRTPTHSSSAVRPHATGAATAKQIPAPGKTVKPKTTKTITSRAHTATAPQKAANAVSSSARYTLQLSAASRSDTLAAWAKKNQLQNYHIYATHRNGQPWYILVSGNYATAAEARRAIATLPAAVRAQQPWPKPLKQIKGESR